MKIIDSIPSRENLVVMIKQCDELEDHIKVGYLNLFLKIIDFISQNFAYKKQKGSIMTST